MKNSSTSDGKSELNDVRNSLDWPATYSHRHGDMLREEWLVTPADESTSSALTQGIYHRVQDWVALELTAEQMLSNEVGVVTRYLADDAHEFWEAVKTTLQPYEIALGQFLLEAADPTQVDWLQNRWWSSETETRH